MYALKHLRHLSSSWRQWTEAASNKSLAWLGTKCSRWYNGWVAQTSLGVYSCQKRALWAFSVIQEYTCWLLMFRSKSIYAVSPECRCSTHRAEAEVWTHNSDTSRRLTLAAYPLANNIQTVYHCLQVSTLGSSILSDRNVCSGCWQHWPSLSSFSSTWRSDGAQNENDNVWITELCSLRTMCLERFATDFAFVIHHTWTVPEQTKDNTISLDLRDVTWHFRDYLGR